MPVLVLLPLGRSCSLCTSLRLRENHSRSANANHKAYHVVGTFENQLRWNLKVIFQDEEHEELVLVRDVPFYSCCEHHLVPFFGKAHIAYLPKEGRLTGLSKLARVIETLAKRPQLQERITKYAADIIMEELNPYGVIVVVEAEHMCMTMRGVKKPGSKTITSAVRGIFEKDIAARAEAMSLITMK